jgi:5-methylcytosine-specific restriction endonuclease McrA
MIDEDITKKAGIYWYVLNNNEKHLSLRAFTDKIKREVFEKQEGICIKCGNKFELNEMEADHITPWSEGGKTISDNCQLLCKHCNRTKSNK